MGLAPEYYGGHQEPCRDKNKYERQRIRCVKIKRESVRLEYMKLAGCKLWAIASGACAEALEIVKGYWKANDIEDEDEGGKSYP